MARPPSRLPTVLPPAALGRSQLFSRWACRKKSFPFDLANALSVHRFAEYSAISLIEFYSLSVTGSGIAPQHPFCSVLKTQCPSWLAGLDFISPFRELQAWHLSCLRTTGRRFDT
jgi:hypothetical protein